MEFGDLSDPVYDKENNLYWSYIVADSSPEDFLDKCVKAAAGKSPVHIHFGEVQGKAFMFYSYRPGLTG